MGLEPMMKLLQSLALPTWPRRQDQSMVVTGSKNKKTRAGDRARTDNLFLGKETFYQLNYARTFSVFVCYSGSEYSIIGLIRQPFLLNFFLPLNDF